MSSEVNMKIISLLYTYILVNINPVGELPKSETAVFGDTEAKRTPQHCMTSDRSDLWPNAVVPYKLSDNLSELLYTLITFQCT